MLLNYDDYLHKSRGGIMDELFQTNHARNGSYNSNSSSPPSSHDISSTAINSIEENNLHTITSRVSMKRF